MANSSRARRYGSAGASVLLAASLSLGALPSVAAANTPNPDNPPVITVYNYKVETNTRELKTALRLNKITFKATNLPAKTTAFSPALHEANHRGFPFLNPIQTVHVAGPFKDGTATATHYVPGSLIDPAKNYSFVANIAVDGYYSGGQVLRMDVVKDSAAPVLQVDSPRLNTKGETVLKVRGTGYTGEATPHGVRVVVSDTNVWVPGRFPQQGMRFAAQVTVPASQIHNGAFETEVKVPADVAATLNTSHKYIVGTMAAGVEGAEYGSFDAQKPLELFAQEPVVSAVPTYAPTVAPLPEATVGVNPTDAPTVPALPEAPVADKTPNADKLEDATVAHPKSKPAQSKPAQEAPVTAARSAMDTPTKDGPAKDSPAKDHLAQESSPKKATLANTGASSVGVIVGIGIVAICAGLGLSVLRSRRSA
ncbi:hypothetical protein [Rothia sp. (in: high G+C Gram-positive bacteria)]|uniref:hypothetical protein n=1 Tax=Rothia sp. (in: high G+C Gram-positive bacteria) TaxID=1885016 RepID=UPI0025EB3C60|nr:hypothetical protein [Rothia sp. (in: high G+C Gram-positive bacteria)]